MSMWDKLESALQALTHGLTKRLDAIEQTQTRILTALTALQKGETQIMVDLTALQQEVADETAVDKSVETLLDGLTAKIQTLIAQSGNTVDPVALQAIVDGMKANKAGLVAAVTANTPAA